MGGRASITRVMAPVARASLCLLPVLWLGACRPERPGWKVVFDELEAPLRSAWQADDGTLFAVGGSATRALVLRHDENGWWEMDVGTDAALWWVFGFSSTHVYAVGERGTVAYFNGRRWEVRRQQGRNALYGVWGPSPSDLWAVGGAPTFDSKEPELLRWRDGAWTPRTVLPGAGAFFKVWGRSSDDVWIVGEGGLAAHFTAGSLETSNPAAQRLTTVFGDATNLWAVGGLSTPQLVRFDGETWHVLDQPGLAGRVLFGGAVDSTGRTVIVGAQGYVAAGPGTELSRLTPATGLDLHAAAPVQGGFVAVGGDLFGSGTRGVLISDAPLAPGPFQSWPEPGVSLVAADSGTAAPDGGRPDAGTIAPGDFCDHLPSGCGPSDECWLLVGPDRAICTRLCTSVADCSDFGPSCCMLPGPQVTTPTCIPRSVEGMCPDGG